MPALRTLLLLLLLLLLLPGVAAAQEQVVNAPTLRYMAAGSEREIAANILTLEVERERLPSRITARVPPPSLATGEARCEGARLVAAPVDAATSGALVAAAIDPSAPLLIVLSAPGSNRDPATRETVTLDFVIDGGHRPLVLTETTPDSGEFAGALPATGSRGDLPCAASIGRDAAVALAFAGDAGSFPSTLVPAVDPANLVFDAASGALVDGASVTLLTEAGVPATVMGEDGTSAYPATVISGAEVVDDAGRRYPAIRGRYRFPMVAAGRYRLKVVPPGGYTAPSRAPPVVLAALRDPAGAPFVLNGASGGGIVALARSGPFAADTPLDRELAPSLLLTRTLSVREASPGDRIEARLLLVNRGPGASGPLRLVDILPAGLRYRAGSMRGAGEPVVAADGRSIDAALSSLPAGGSVELRFILTVPPGAAIGEAAVRAQASGPLATSNVAAAAVRIRPLLFTDALTIVGQVGEGDGCGVAGKGVGGIRLLLEDGSAVITDPAGLYHLEGVTPGRHVLALDRANLPPGLEPVDCARDTAGGGSATSRFVEGAGGLIRRADFRLRRVAGAAASVAPALPITPLDDGVAAGNRDWLAGRKPGIEWLFPAPDYNPRAPVTRVAIAHAPDQRVALTINGKPVDPLSFDATDADNHGVAVSRWVGIPLAPGDNRLVARVLADDGRLVTTLERGVTVSGPPVHAAIDTAHSRLAADGVTPPLVAVRVTDAAGRPVRAGTLVPFAVDAPYAAAIDAARLVRGERDSTPVIGDDGLAFLPLRPTAQAGAVALHIAFPVGDTVRTSDIEAWLVAAATRWTVVGFGAGSLGYDTLSSHVRALAPTQRDGRIVDGQLALYAKGRIKGSWLLTFAYDSARRVDRDRGLTGQVQPDRYYTVYGDGAAQGHDAPSASRLYLRLESRQAYALFGDIETGIDTGLTRYARTLTGWKAAYRGEHWRATGFATRVATVAGHDEIQGNGLSGPYRLRARFIVPNTDTLRIEVRDRYRSERIVSTTPLTRDLDYTIDPAAGLLRFTKPVLSRDAALDPIVIVADYEVENGGADRLAAGGRVEHHAGALAIGASVVHDETRTARAGVAGVDARLRLSPGTTLSAEAATGGDRGLAGATAYVAQVEHHGGGVDLTVYARQQAAGFGLGQQSLVEAGTRKLGADLRWSAGPIAVTATGWYQAQLGGPGERVAAQARIDWHRGTRTLFAGVDLATDRGLDGGERVSRLLTLGADQVLAGGALTIAGQTQFAPGGDRASVDFPVRHQLTSAWRLSSLLRVEAGYEIDDGAANRARTARLGLELTPWSGARVATSLADQGVGEQGRRFAQSSIAQSLPLGEHWSVDATLDSAATLSGAIPTGAMVTPFQPVGAAGALGQDAGDFTAATFGTAWRAGAWSARGRAEYRRGANDTRWSLSGDLLRRLGEGRTLAASARTYRVVNAANTTAANTTAASTIADVALAWRPPASRWALLDRLTLRHDRGDPVASTTGGATLGTSLVLGGADGFTTRLINNAAIDYRSAPGGRGYGLEVSLYYGIKYVSGRYADESVAGLIDATGIALRQGLGPHLDIGAAASVQHAWSDRRWAWSGGPSLGLSPAADLWVSVGYNVAGYRDRDLAEDRYSRRGPYLTTRFKFDARRIGMAARSLGIGR